MNVITNRPIYSEPNFSSQNSNFDNEFDSFDNEFENFDDDFSNCAGCPNCGGTSNFDDDFSYSCGCSGFEGDYSNADDDAKKEKGSKFKALVSKFKPKDDRDTRIKNRSVKKQLRKDKKPKKNAEKLTVFKKKDGSERYLFNLSKLKFGKKKKKDGSETPVAGKDVAVVTNPKTGENIEVDKKEIAKATGITEEKLTPEQIKKVVVVNPETNEVAVEVPEKLVEKANDGEVYVSTDIQDIKEPTKDVDDKGLSKTQKVVLWSVGGVALLIVGFLVYKAVTKTPTKIV